MWERTIRDWIGASGTFDNIKGFRRRRFTSIAEHPTVIASVSGKLIENGVGILTLHVHAQDSAGVTVGPGSVDVTLPLRRDGGRRTG